MIAQIKRWFEQRRQRQIAIEAALDAMSREWVTIFPVSIAVVAVHLRRRLSDQGIQIGLDEACEIVERRGRQRRRKVQK